MSPRYIKRKEILVNPKSKEEVTVVSIIPEVREHSSFVKVYKTLSAKVISDLKVGLDGAVETMFWLIDQVMELNNLHRNPEIYAHPKDIAQALGTTERTIKRHLKLLKDLKYIRQVQPKQYVFQFDPYLLFYGTISKYLSHEISKIPIETESLAAEEKLKSEPSQEEVTSKPKQDAPSNKDASKKAGRTKRSSDSKRGDD